MKPSITTPRVDGSARNIISQIKSFLSGSGWHRQAKGAETSNQAPSQAPSKVETSAGGTP